MVYIVSVLISLLILGQYISGKHANVLTGLMLSAIACFEPNLDIIGLDNITIRGIGQNAFFFSVIFIFCCWLKKNKSKKYREIAAIEKIAILMFLYTSIIALYTLLTGKESLFNVIALMKPYTAFLAIFFIKDISAEDCVKSIKTTFKLTTIVGIIAVLQVVLHFNIFGFTSLDYNEGVDRFWSPYTLASLCLFISLILLKKRKMAFFVFFLFLVLLPLRRGLIVSVAATLALYYLYQLKHGTLNKSIFLVILLGGLSFTVLVNRFTASGDNAVEDLSVISSGQADYVGQQKGNVSGGSFMLRALILIERVDYLVQNPSKMLTGVGLIHEDTAQKMFNFYLGSRKTVNGEIIYQQIDNGDIVWPPILMRIGFIGLFLYLLFFFKLLKFYYSYIKYSKWAFVGFCFLFNYLVNSIADYPLTDYHAFLLYYIILVIVISEKRERQVVSKVL